MAAIVLLVLLMVDSAVTKVKNNVHRPPPVTYLLDSVVHNATLLTTELLELFRPVVRQVAVPSEPPNVTAPPSCKLPTMSPKTERFRWETYGEPMTVYYDRLRAAGVRMFSSGNGTPPARRVPPISFSPNPITPQDTWLHAIWRPWSIVPSEPPPFVVVFRNVWVKGGWVLDCHRAFTTGACFQDDAHVHSVRNPQFFARAVVLGDEWAHGYFHFTNEQLPRVAIMYDALKADPTIKIMSPSNAFARSFLEDVLGFNHSRLIPHMAEYQFGTAYYPSPSVCGNGLLQPLLLLRQIVFRRLNLSDTMPLVPHQPTVLFPLRNDSRQPLNHDEMVASCRRRFPNVRFWEQNFRDWPARKQIEAFNSVDIVVGAHGANLANIVFMRFQSTVVEFVPGLTCNPCYYTLAARLGMDYRMIVVPNRAQRQRNTVSEDEVIQHLATALHRIRHLTSVS
eukprot:GGOE01063109.1.p1 GENE.GGOE01063109.1~~GGOE01063109.1.p1  ORF type:complete len:469 (+),score=84.79 GGOE01063109.1:56-1408(+)